MGFECPTASVRNRLQQFGDKHKTKVVQVENRCWMCGKMFFMGTPASIEIKCHYCNTFNYFVDTEDQSTT